MICKANFKPAYRLNLCTCYILKFLSTCYIHVPSIFCRSCWIKWFLHCCCNVKNIWVPFLRQITIHTNISTLWNSSNSVQKPLDLTTTSKNTRKMNITYLTLRTKKVRDLAYWLVWNLYAYTACFFWNVNIQIPSTSTYSVIRLYLVGAFYSSAIHCSSMYFKWGTAIFQIKHINIHIPDIVMCIESKLVTSILSHLTNRISPRILASIIKKPDWNQESYYLSNS